MADEIEQMLDIPKISPQNPNNVNLGKVHITWKYKKKRIRKKYVCYFYDKTKIKLRHLRFLFLILQNNMYFLYFF